MYAMMMKLPRESLWFLYGCDESDEEGTVFTVCVCVMYESRGFNVW